MAVATGYSADSADMQAWYNAFNAFITSYASSIGTLSVPAANKLIEDVDVNNLNTKINAFKNDTYLSTKASWWTSGTVSDGTAIQPPSFIVSTISNFQYVKCRNEAQNNKGTHSQCCETNSNHSQGCANQNHGQGCAN